MSAVNGIDEEKVKLNEFDEVEEMRKLSFEFYDPFIKYKTMVIKEWICEDQSIEELVRELQYCLIACGFAKETVERYLVLEQ